MTLSVVPGQQRRTFHYAKQPLDLMRGLSNEPVRSAASDEPMARKV
jgi:hypothetical protein